LVLKLPRHANSLRLDSDSTLTLDIHAVKILSTHRPVIDNTGELKHAVSQGRFTVVNVRNNAEIADEIRVSLSGLKR
jgi:hypothetical protein